MCVTRVAKVLSLNGAKARVRFLDGDVVGEVDVSMVEAKKGSYLEVFAERAIGCITKKDAEFKRDLRLELNRIRATVP